MKRLHFYDLLTAVCLLLTPVALHAQTRYDYSRLQREHLNRGVVAVRTADDKVAVSWRTLMSDPKGQVYDIYRRSAEDCLQGREGEKLNREPLTAGGTFFIDEHPLEGDATYEVRVARSEERGASNQDVGTRSEERGTFVLKAGAPVGYLPIPIQKPEGRYSANDASDGQVDGDGQYDIIL